jgi:hypothetical protein
MDGVTVDEGSVEEEGSWRKGFLGIFPMPLFCDVVALESAILEDGDVPWP